MKTKKIIVHLTDKSTLTLAVFVECNYKEHGWSVMRQYPDSELHLARVGLRRLRKEAKRLGQDVKYRLVNVTQIKDPLCE